MSQFFSTQRLQRAMLNDVLPLVKLAAWVTLIQLVITALLYLGYDRERAGEDFPISQSIFAVYLLVVGLVLTSASFQDMHHPLERYRYLLLPISNFERYLSRYLLTGPLFVIFMIVAFTIMDWSGNLVTQWILETSEPLFNQFSKLTWWTVYVYLALHAIMFTGAICFRSYALVKTVLTTMLVCAGVPASVYLAMRIFYFDSFSWTKLKATKDIDVLLAPEFAARWMNEAVIVLFIAWILYIAYRCLKEHEVQE
jgi:hypothetical protein